MPNVLHCDDACNLEALRSFVNAPATEEAA
jgi:hypothetical protein